MKRSHSQVVTPLSVLPDSIKGNQKVLKSTLTGTHRLRVVSVLDISKPASKPVDEIEEPEEEDKALQNRLNKSNARMLLLQLEDSAKNQIKALETEVIAALSSVKKSWIVSLEGPAEIRCGNIMLASKNVTKVEEVNVEDEIEPDQTKRQDVEVVEDVKPPVKSADILDIKNIPLVDLDGDFDDDESDDCIVIE